MHVIFSHYQTEISGIVLVAYDDEIWRIPCEDACGDEVLLDLSDPDQTTSNYLTFYEIKAYTFISSKFS